MSESSSYRRRTLFVIGPIGGLVTYDWASTNVSVATLRDSLHFSAQWVPWIHSFYLLTFGGFLMLGGRLADLYGRRRILLVGLAIFALFSLISALAGNVPVFLAARFFKGIGAALLLPNTYALLNSLFPEGKERHAALGIYGFLGSTGYALGNLLGGVLTSYNWRATIAVSAVSAIILFILAGKWLHKEERGPAEGGFDYAGAVLSTLGFGTLIFTVSKAVQLGIGSPITLSLFGLSFACFLGFWLSNRSHPFPIVPHHLIRIRNVLGAAIVGFFITGSGTGTFFLVALFLQDVLKFSANETGLALIPFVLMGLLTNLFLKRILNSLGFHRTLLLGLLINLAAISYFALLTKHSGYLFGLLPGLLLWEFGCPLAFVGVKIPAGAGLEPKEQGIANGFNHAVEQLGSAFGITLFAAINVAGRSWSGTSGLEGAEFGFHWAFATSVLFIVLALTAALLILREKPARKEENLFAPIALLEAESVP